MESKLLYRCGDCKWYDEDQCGLVMSIHFKEDVDIERLDCPDWTDKLATEGSLSNGNCWESDGWFTRFWRNVD